MYRDTPASMEKQLFFAVMDILHEYWIVPLQKRRFRIDLESIFIQRYTLYCRERSETFPLGSWQQRRFRNLMIVGLNHPRFPSNTLWFFRCPRCGIRQNSDPNRDRSRRFIWSEIDKGSAFVCERCGYERFYFRRVYRQR